MADDILSHQDMADGLRQMATSKKFWLDNFSSGGKKRPEHEVTQQRQHLKVLNHAADHFQAMANRREPVDG